jgi:hypothetical protein
LHSTQENHPKRPPIRAFVDPVSSTNHYLPFCHGCPMHDHCCLTDLQAAQHGKTFRKANNITRTMDIYAYGNAFNWICLGRAKEAHKTPQKNVKQSNPKSSEMWSTIVEKTSSTKLSNIVKQVFTNRQTSNRKSSKNIIKHRQTNGHTSSTKSGQTSSKTMVKHRQTSCNISSNKMICLVGPPRLRIGPPALNL